MMMMELPFSCTTRLVNKQLIKSLSTNRPSMNGHWMPFTDHDRFKKHPKFLENAKGMYYYDENNKEILDGHSGLWCVNAGHCHPKIVEAVQKQVAKLDYSPGFNISHKGTITFANKILDTLPGRGFSEVFFTMCGSSAVDTSLKIYNIGDRKEKDNVYVLLAEKEDTMVLDLVESVSVVLCQIVKDIQEICYHLLIISLILIR
jgi:4-aminobutyrate aminotransferase-like enzyme